MESLSAGVDNDRTARSGRAASASAASATTARRGRLASTRIAEVRGVAPDRRCREGYRIHIDREPAVTGDTRRNRSYLLPLGDNRLPRNVHFDIARAVLGCLMAKRGNSSFSHGRGPACDAHSICCRAIAAAVCTCVGTRRWSHRLYAVISTVMTTGIGIRIGQHIRIVEGWAKLRA